MSALEGSMPPACGEFDCSYIHNIIRVPRRGLYNIHHDLQYYIYIYIASSTAVDLIFLVVESTVVTPTRTPNDGIYIYDGPDVSSLSTLVPAIYRDFTTVCCKRRPLFTATAEVLPYKRIKYNSIYNTHTRSPPSL